jgi:hypothetical protein
VNRRILAAAVTSLALSLTACSTAASYQTRMAYLRKIANRGVETHNLLASQGAQVTAKRCGDAFEGLKDESPPIDTDPGPSKAWVDQIKQFFVDSCVTGYPKPVPGGTPQAPPKNSPSPTTPTPPVSPSLTKHT